jgi:hypothetical protein
MDNPYASLINAAAQQSNIDPRLLTAVIGTESSFNPSAVNASTGATGLGQQIPATAQSLGIDPKDPGQSIQGAARQLAENLQRYGNPEQAVMAYHGGTDPNNWGPNTQDYLAKVSNAYKSQGQAMDQAQAQPASNDPLDQMLAAKASGAPVPATQPASASADPLDAMLAQKASGQEPVANVVPRGTPLAQSPDQQYRSTLSSDRQQQYDKLVSDLRSQANFIQTGPNAGPVDRLMGGAWRGLNDASDFLTGGAGFVGQGLGLVKPETMDDYMHATDQLRNEYEQSRQAAASQNVGGLSSGQKPNAGIDWGRSIGQGLAGGAATRALELGGTGVSSLLGSAGNSGILGSDLASSATGRFLQNAFTGGTSAAVASPQSDTPVGTQTAIGAGIGAVLPPALGKVASAAISPFLRQAAGDVAPEASQAANAIQSAAGSAMGAINRDASGAVSIDSSKLAPNVQQALQTGALKNLTPEQQARVFTYESLGVPYSMADVTRNAADAMTERNLAQNAKVGAPIRDLDAAKNQALTQAAQRAVDMTGQQPGDAYSIGSDIRQHLQNQYQAFNGKINQAYQAADEAAGGAPSVSTNPIANTLKGMRSQFLASSDGLGLLNGIRGRLQEFTGGVPKNPGTPILLDANGTPLLNSGDLPKTMTFSDSERFRQYLNDVSTPDNYPLIKAVKNAVDQSQDASGSGPIYENARNLRQQRSAMFENQSGVAKILANTPGGDPRMPVDRIMDNYVFNKGNSDQLSQLINQLNKGGQEGQDVLNRLRSTSLQSAVANSISKTPGETGQGAFSGPMFKSQLDKIGPTKMGNLFTPEQQNYLGALQRGAIDLTTSPTVRNTYNNSGTAAQAVNMLDLLSGSAPQPGLGSKLASAGPTVGATIGSVLGPAGAATGAWLGGVAKSRAEKGAEQAAEAYAARQTQAAVKPLQTMLGKQANSTAQQDKLRQAIAQRLMGTAALGGAIQPSN